MSALPGTHLCAEHQGNHSHYASHNCEICKLTAERDELLKALHLAIPALVQCERAYRQIGAAVGQGEFERALIKVQAIIDKHKPTAAPAATAT